MTIVLPVQLGSASGWSLADYVTRRVQSKPAAGGVTEINLGQLRDDELWLVDHAVVSCTSSTPTQLRWYESRVADLALLDGTSNGNFDVGDWTAGLQVGSSESLIAQWTGCSAGSIASISVQLRVMRR